MTGLWGWEGAALMCDRQVGFQMTGAELDGEAGSCGEWILTETQVSVICVFYTSYWNTGVSSERLETGFRQTTGKQARSNYYTLDYIVHMLNDGMIWRQIAALVVP